MGGPNCILRLQRKTLSENYFCKVSVPWAKSSNWCCRSCFPRTEGNFEQKSYREVQKITFFPYFEHKTINWCCHNSTTTFYVFGEKFGKKLLGEKDTFFRTSIAKFFGPRRNNSFPRTKETFWMGEIIEAFLEVHSFGLWAKKFQLFVLKQHFRCPEIFQFPTSRFDQNIVFVNHFIFMLALKS